VSMLTKLRVAVLSAGICWLPVGLALAQQDRADRSGANQSSSSASKPSRSGQNVRPASAQNGRTESQGLIEGAQANGASASGIQSRQVEQYVTAWLLADTEAELELSQFAQQHATSRDVKELAKTIVQHHQKIIQELRPLAGGDGSSAQNGRSAATGTADSTTQSASSPGGGLSVNSLGPGGSAAAQPSAGAGVVHQLMQLNRQIIERESRATRDELQRNSGVEFDESFVSAAIHSHTNALAVLDVVEQQGHGDLARIAQQARPIVQQHLEHARQLVEKLERERGNSATASRR
jgi:predicted outer membrane protein